MLYVRPVAIEDLDALLALATLAGVGLTTLPSDRDLLGRRIQKSVHSMERIPDRPGGESYLFVMIDSATEALVGASGIVSKVGGFEPFYAFRVDQKWNHSDELNVHKPIPLLQLVKDHNGPAEVGSLFLAPKYRGGNAGRFLQLIRFLFLAQHKNAFETVVVSELRGVIDETGRSAFWDAVGRHFFDIDFPRADYLSVVNKKFIADLMPKHPIYIELLPADAQGVIGKVHEQSRPAMRVLEAEGFSFSGMVDIFDAGACLSCHRDEIRTVRQCRSGNVREIFAAETESPEHVLNMVATCGSQFRACLATLGQQGGAVDISQACAQILGISAGDPVCYAPLRSAVEPVPAPAAGEEDLSAL